MEKIYMAILFLFFTASSFAQGSDLCDGERFIDEVFEEVTITNAVKFGERTLSTGGVIDLLMDVYEPAGDVADDRPVVVMAHGGSFITGTRANEYMQTSCTALAKRGYVAASIDYTLWPLFLGLPDSLDLLGIVVDAVGDMKTSIRYFRQDAATENVFNINPDLIMAGGYSAGAVIACQVGIMDEDDIKPDFLQTIIDDNGGINGDGNHQEYSSDIIAILNFSGGVYKTDWIDSNDTPIFSMHGTADATVAYNHGLAAGIMSLNGSGLIHPKAEAVNLQNEILTIEGGGHTDIYFQAQFADARATLDEKLYPFLENVLCSFVSSNTELANVETRVFPNPSSDYVNFSFGLNEVLNYDLTIYDQLGRVVETRSNLSGNTFQIQKYKTGMYFVKIEFENTYSTIVKTIVFK